MDEKIELLKPGWRFQFRNEQGKAIVAQLKTAQEKRESSLQLVKTTTGRRRIYLFTPAGCSEKFLLKAYLPAKISKRLKYLVRNSRCKQEFFASQKLAQLKIPAVSAIAFGTRWDKGVPAEELVIEPYLEDVQPFDQLWKKLEKDQAKELFRTLVQLVLEMHRKGVLQRDFKPDSILAKKSDSGFELLLADLERIKFYRKPLSQTQRIDNLGKMLQSFFSLLPCEEEKWLLDFYQEAEPEFKKPQIRHQIILRAKKHLWKLAKQRKSWAKNTNELIEKFETPKLIIRVSRTIGKSALEQWLKNNPLPDQGIIEIAGKKLELHPCSSAQEQMENYFFLRELKIKCRALVLAIDFKKERKGIFGLLISDSEKPYAQVLPELSNSDRLDLLAKYAEFISRLELLGLKLKDQPSPTLLVARTSSRFEIILPSPEQIQI